jgi:polysaccharide chain length determinant protein (PEP-CTERM system associated)
MLPGKTYTVDDVVRIARRRIWWLLVPFALVAAATALLARALPDMYRSETLVQIVPQQVPSSFVKPVVTTSIEDRLQSIRQQILSRTRLEQLIMEFNLYPEERQYGIMEDIVQRMRDRDIQIQVVNGNSFRISFIGRDANTVAKVTGRQASLFIGESLQDRKNLSEGTNDFLEQQLVKAHDQLQEIERRLADYNRSHTGELPSQLDANLQQVRAAQMQQQALADSLNRDQDMRIELERQLAQARTPIVTVPAANGSAPTSTAQQLAVARAQLADYETRYKPGHPDLEAARRAVHDLEQKARDEAAAAGSPDGAEVLSPAEAARQQQVSNLQAQIDELDRQMTRKRADQQKLQSSAAEYQRRVEATPNREAELTELTRDYKNWSDRYSSLLSRKEDAQLAANLESRQIGETFRLLDPARVPERPYSPNRQRLTAMGLAGGLAVGAALVLLLEYTDRTFKTDEEASLVLDLPVVAVVPLMQSDAERRRRGWRRLALGTLCGTTVLAGLAVVAYTLVR